MDGSHTSLRFEAERLWIRHAVLGDAVARRRLPNPATVHGDGHREQRASVAETATNVRESVRVGAMLLGVDTG
jgi:hypothetical protein